MDREMPEKSGYGCLRKLLPLCQKREILGQRSLRDAVPDVERISVSFQMSESNH